MSAALIESPEPAVLDWKKLLSNQPCSHCGKNTRDHFQAFSGTQTVLQEHCSNLECPCPRSGGSY